MNCNNYIYVNMKDSNPETINPDIHCKYRKRLLVTLHIRAYVKQCHFKIALYSLKAHTGKLNFPLTRGPF